jgi:twitching motility protein PilT
LYNVGIMEIEKLLRLMAQTRASDMHLTVDSPPVFRIDGVLVPVEGSNDLTDKDIDMIFEQITSLEQRQVFNNELELDLNYSIPDVARFRINAMKQRGTISLAFRMVPIKVPTVDEMELPAILKELIMKPNGLILITGATGSGKSTTLAAMINHLNENEKRNIITVENPIEFLFKNNKSIIRQRDLGYDTRSFSAALIYALRHDPDVIVVGEMRDLSTISAAVTAAETGHLVIGTLCTINTVQAIDRIIDMFPSQQQRQIRLQLSQIIEAVTCQQLIPRIGGGRAAAVEVVIANNVIRQFILEAKVNEIIPNVEMSKLEGMQSMDQALAHLVRQNKIAMDEAMLRTGNPAKLKKLLE